MEGLLRVSGEIYGGRFEGRKRGRTSLSSDGGLQGRFRKPFFKKHHPFVPEDLVGCAAWILFLHGSGDNCFIKRSRNGVYIESAALWDMGNGPSVYDAVGGKYSSADAAWNFTLSIMGTLSASRPFNSYGVSVQRGH